MKIILTNKQLEYLQLSLPDHLKGVCKNLNIKSDFPLDITEDSLDEIRDWAGVKLQSVGFDQDFKLTEEGRILEDLIDLFYM